MKPNEIEGVSVLTKNLTLLVDVRGKEAFLPRLKNALAKSTAFCRVLYLCDDADRTKYDASELCCVGAKSFDDMVSQVKTPYFMVVSADSIPHEDYYAALLSVAGEGIFCMGNSAFFNHKGSLVRAWRAETVIADLNDAARRQISAETVLFETVPFQKANLLFGQMTVAQQIALIFSYAALCSEQKILSKHFLIRAKLYDCLGDSLLLKDGPQQEAFALYVKAEKEKSATASPAKQAFGKIRSELGSKKRRLIELLKKVYWKLYAFHNEHFKHRYLD